MKRLAVLVAAVLVGGCGPSVDFSLVGFDEPEYQQIRYAMDEWCAKSGGDFCPTVYGDDNSISKSESLGAENIGLCSTITNDYGMSKYDIKILDKSADNDWLEHLRVTVLHELGHAGGCRHLGPGNVMSADDEGSPKHLTPSDSACVTSN